MKTDPVAAPPHRAAGIVTRLLAAGADGIIVLLTMAGLYLGLAGLLFLWSPTGFHWPPPTLLRAILLGSVIAFGYLATAWATTGRTYGAAVLGLRVLSTDHQALGWIRAGLRALTCVVFPAGLLWVAVSRHRRSLQDILLRSIVVYDWYHRSGIDSHSEIENRVPTPREPIGSSNRDRPTMRSAQRPAERVEPAPPADNDAHRANTARPSRAEQPPHADIGTDGSSAPSDFDRANPAVNQQVREEPDRGPGQVPL